MRTLGVSVTDDDVTLGELGRSLARIEAKVDTVTGDHEKRIRAVERWVYALPPTAVLAIASAAAAILK